MKTLSFSAVLTFFLLFQPSAKGHNNHFLPGDAFFSVSITRDVINQWIKAEQPDFDFTYSRFDGKHMADGNMGYTKLRVQGISQKFRETLTKAYWRYTALERPLYRLESDDQEIYTQTNGVVALIYSKEFGGPLGLKFNENWQIEGLRRYSGLFSKAKPIIDDWKLGPEFLPLRTINQLPPLAHIPLEGEKKHAMTNPVSVKAEDIKVIFVGFANQDDFEATQTCPNLQAIYDRVAGTKYMIVDQDGFTAYTCTEKREWKQARTTTP